MKDGIPKMTISLVAFAAIACVALAFVYAGTKDAIDGHAAKDLQAAQQQLFPKAQKFTEINVKSDDPTVTFDADTNNGKVTKRYQWAATEGGKLAGVEIRASSAGFQDNVQALVGIDLTGAITGVKILYDADTPGLGQNAVNDSYFVSGVQKGKQISKLDKVTFQKQFSKSAKNPGLTATDNIKVQKDGGDVIALTAATITSRAVSRIVSAAAKAGYAYIKANGGK
jgi:electron transport complex protein RnfG